MRRGKGIGRAPTAANLGEVRIVLTCCGKPLTTLHLSDDASDPASDFTYTAGPQVRVVLPDDSPTEPEFPALPIGTEAGFDAFRAYQEAHQSWLDGLEATGLNRRRLEVGCNACRYLGVFSPERCGALLAEVREDASRGGPRVVRKEARRAERDVRP